MNRAHDTIRHAAGIACLSLLFGIGPAVAQVTGAVYTTFWTGTAWDVNHNIYPDKPSVFLPGGPTKQSPGIGPDGDYYFQVTSPSGEVLLSTDDIACRRVTVAGGMVVAVVPGPGGCEHKTATQLGLSADTNGNDPVQLIPFSDTPNPGGEYKAWMTPVERYDATATPCNGAYGFCNDFSKTDNFKVKLPGRAYIVACKFWDHDGNGVRDPVTEELLSGWDINAAFIYNGSADPPSYLETRTTDDTGCTTFTVQSLDTFGFPSVSLSETLKNGWIQTAPTPPTAIVAPDPNQDATIYFGNYSLFQDDAIKVSKDVLPTVKYKWTIDKVAEPAQINQAAATATFSYSVTVSHDAGTPKLGGTIKVENGLSVDVSGMKLVDNPGNGGICTLSAGAGNFSVPAQGSKSFDYSCSFSGTVDQGINEVVLSDANDTEIDHYTIPYDFALAEVLDGQIEVTDPNAPVNPLGTVDILGSNPTKFTYKIDWTGTPGTCKTFDNTATFTATGTGSTGATGSDKETVKLCVGADLQVSKTATPAFKRTYTWTIGKAVDKTRVEQSSLLTQATFNYTVVASQTGFTDSDWTVNGKITVYNPNDWESITFNASDAVPGGSCSVTGGTNVVLAAGASVDLDYSCTFATKPAYSTDITNTATASWDSAAAFTTNASASGTKKFQFTDPTTLANQTITVTDTFNGTTTTLGTLTATNAPPYASATYTYSHSVDIPASGCIDYKNVAKIVETGQSADKTVTVCRVPAKTGALTMGFWQNKNGQGIITGGSSTAGVCNSATWLRTYAPFQDLSSTASCSVVATYVFNVIKAANASGASMNAMLKAQMLATALDVYFSDTALGGNKIGATGPIGGVSIDLTMICKDIAACTIYENTSAAFGGASSMTVLQLLSYAAGQSNSGGSTWYGQVKATQELAKDTFDAINNQKAFTP